MHFLLSVGMITWMIECFTAIYRFYKVFQSQLMLDLILNSLLIIVFRTNFFELIFKKHYVYWLETLKKHDLSIHFDKSTESWAQIELLNQFDQELLLLLENNLLNNFNLFITQFKKALQDVFTLAAKIENLRIQR